MSLRLAIAELPGLPELLDSVVPGFVRRGGGTSVPGIPQNVVATPGDTFADIAWDAVIGATLYNLYRDGVFIVAVDVPGTVHNEGLTNGVTYSYTVTATNAGGESAQSDPATVTPEAFTYLQPDGIGNYLQPDGVGLYLQP